MALSAADHEVHVTNDQMEAYLTLTNPDAGSPSYEDLVKALAGNRVVSGIKEEVLKKLAQKPEFNVSHQVAQGTPSEDGKHQKIEYRFDVSASKGAEEDEQGSIDFRNIKNFINFKAGQVLAEKTAASQGKPGKNVLGQDVPARDGKEVNFKTGKGVEISEDGMAALAAVDGHPALIADRLTVQNTVEVPAHVDYSIGNIDFIGNVRVRGDVMPGFTVKVKGNLEIAGNVEQASLEVGGNLDLRGIIFGQDKSTVTVRGDAKIGAIDQAIVHVHGHLKVNNYVRHSTVLVGATMEVVGPKGNIVGGEIDAYQVVNCPYIGNPMATLTKLTVGMNPFVAADLAKVQDQYTELEGKLKQITTAIAAASARGNKPLLEKLHQAKKQLDPALKQLGEQLQDLQARGSEYKDAKIRIKDKVFPGVVINFRDRLQYKTMDEAQRLSFYEEGAEIRTGPY